MGVTINYRGHLNHKNSIQQFINEVADICKSMDWDYNILDEDWSKTAHLEVEYGEEGVSLRGHAGLKGVTFKPHEKCEPVRLTFDSDQQLNSVMNIAFGIQEEEDKIPWVFTKTQFAGVEVHISIIKLLKYLKKKYISDLEVKDEGDYWESEDDKEVANRMGMIENAMNALQEGLQSLENLEDLTEDMIMKKIEDVIENIGDQDGIQVKVMRIDSVLKEFDELDEAEKEIIDEFFSEEESLEEDLTNFLKGNIQNGFGIDSIIEDVEYLPENEDDLEEEDDEDEMPF